MYSFISNLEEELPNILVFKSDEDEDFLNAKEGLEKLVLKPLHEHFFGIDPHDKVLDEYLRLKIERIVSIVDLKEHLHGPSLDISLLELAVAEFKRIDSYRAPRDKLQCVLNGFRVIKHTLDDLLGVSRWGADQLLPVTIFTILHANPKFLHSNLIFISSFRHPSRLRGEDEYILMQMSVAVRDILEIDELLLKNPNTYTIGDLTKMLKRIKNHSQKHPNHKLLDNPENIKLTELDKFVEIYKSSHLNKST